MCDRIHWSIITEILLNSPHGACPPRVKNAEFWQPIIGKQESKWKYNRGYQMFAQGLTALDNNTSPHNSC